MHVLITGATGNVGSALVRALGADSAVTRITALARRRPDRVATDATFVEADVTRDALEPHMDGIDAVVHLAWRIQPSRSERVTHAVNVGGSARVFTAAVRSGVQVLVHASSVGVYAPGPKDRAVDEAWPATGIPTSFYSRHKAAVESWLDMLEAARPDLRIVRVRPALIFQRAAATEIRRLFIGPLLPPALLQPSRIALVPRHPRLRTQVVHADDVADAYRRALLTDVRGAFNIAAEPVIDGAALARVLDARAVPVPAALIRAGAAVSWRLHLQPTSPGWVDLGLGTPLMSTQRARAELGWTPAHDGEDTLSELLRGLRDDAHGSTPPLLADATGRVC